METTTTRRVRTGWISDVHLGLKGAHAEAFLYFLSQFDFDVLYIVGDFLDIWAMKRRLFWPQENMDVIQKILRKGRKGTRIIYIPGNHDEQVSDLVRMFLHDGENPKYGLHFANVTIMNEDICEAVGGEGTLVLHGHEFDAVIQHIKWLAHLGDWGYGLTLTVSGWLNIIRRKLHLPYWSLSRWLKDGVKEAVSYIGAFEEAVVRKARYLKVTRVVCGHIHKPVIKVFPGENGQPDVTYYNDGDWVENWTALLEEDDGTMHLVQVQQHGNGHFEIVEYEENASPHAEPQVVTAA
jgi:UDP-2,3-diacylglucosamine pyrophosphatase LpxH